MKEKYERKTKENRPVVAICYDFDKTLSPDDMQAQGYIQSVGLDIKQFWEESNGLAEENDMDQNLAYMYKMIKEAEGNFVFNREKLREYGAKVKLFQGVEDWFERIRQYGEREGVIVEHYIISSGLKEMIEGTKMAQENAFTKIYASSFFYNDRGVAEWPAQVINYTNKTQFLFRIEKGVLNVNDQGVNEYFTPDKIRVPFRNMIYIGDTLIVREELAPLILPDGDEASAVRFDALMYGIELAYLAGKKYTRARSDLYKKVNGIASVANIPEIQMQSPLIQKILNTDYLDNAGIDEFEEIREKLRDLMKYIPRHKIRYDTNFEDDLLSAEWKESELENDELKNYKAKAEFYIRQHQDNIVIAKLKTNKPLNDSDISALEQILWNEVGTKQDYEHEYGQKPLGELVREIVGLDMNAAKEAFSEYLTSTSLDSRQIYFVNQIVEYIVHNGMMKDLSVLQESPFTDQGSVVEIFSDLNVWMGIRKVIETINANAAA